MVAAIFVTGLLALDSGLSPAARDLADNDAYMRFLRVENLVEGGGWFDATFRRSNYPFGEVLHWTRPLDVYVAALHLPLRPFLGDSALYWAALVNGPLLLVGVAVASYWAFAGLFGPKVRNLFMPAILGLPLVVAYLGFGRVDHHGPILFIFVMVLGLVMRLLRSPTKALVVGLGIALAIGMWISVEFLVPWALVAATFAVHGIQMRRGHALAVGTGVFGVATVATMVALFLERGPGLFAVEVDRVSVVHVAIGLAATALFGLLVGSQGVIRTRSGLWVLSVIAGAVVAAGLLRIAPELVFGPFGAFDPFVRERWLANVTELSRVSLADGSEFVYRVAPLIAGLGIGLFAMRKGLHQRVVLLLGNWLLAYGALTLLQFRWALFSHYVALILILVVVAPYLEQWGRDRAMALARPLILAGLLAIPLAGSGLDSESARAGVGCSLDPTMPRLGEFDSTTVVADQDIGPEILYRTQHNVVVTPYGNASAFRFLFDVMAARELSTVESMLARRSVGLILVCPGPGDLTYPESPEGTFYHALVDGSHPSFIEEVSLEQTDYRLFSVES